MFKDFFYKLFIANEDDDSHPSLAFGICEIYKQLFFHKP